MIDVYYHICALGNWKNILEYQFEVIVKSGLLAACDNLYIGFLGDNVSDINFLSNRSSKIKVFAFSNYKEHCERLTLNAMREKVIREKENKKIFYLHSKGVTREIDEVKLWTDIMMYFLVENFETCVKLLNIGDTVGVNAINDGNLHQKIDNENHCLCYSGNFWCANSSHIRKLPKIPEIPKNMIPNNLFWLNERWVLCKPGRFIETYHSGYNHLYNIYPNKVKDYKKKFKKDFLILNHSNKIIRIPFR